MKLSFSVALATILAQPQSAYGFSFSSQKNLRAQRHALHASTAVEAVATSGVNNDDSDDSVDFPPPLSAFDRFARAVSFWSTAVPIVANYYGLIGSLKLKDILGDTKKEEEIEVSWM